MKRLVIACVLCSALLAASCVAKPKTCDDKDIDHKIILGYTLPTVDRFVNMDVTDSGKDMLLGLFLGFWNRIPLPDTRTGKYKNSTPIENVMSVCVTLDSSSNGAVENADYWSSDPSKFFGIIAQQDYMSTESVVSNLKDKVFPFFAPCTGVDMSNPQEVWKHNTVMARKSYVSEFIALVNFTVNHLHKTKFGIIYSMYQSLNTFDILNSLAKRFDLPTVQSGICFPGTTNNTELRRYYRDMVDNGAQAIFFPHEDFLLDKFFDAVVDEEASKPSRKPPVLLLVTDYLDATLNLWKGFKFPNRVYIATGFPLFTIDHPLIQAFNKSRSRWISTDRTTYAMLEGFLYARFFLGACVRTAVEKGNVTQENFLKTIFSGRKMVIDGLTFGPYTNRSGNTSLTDSDNDPPYCNPGLRSTYIWTMDKHSQLKLEDSYTRVKGCNDRAEDLEWMLGDMYYYWIPLMIALFFTIFPLVLCITAWIRVSRLKAPEARTSGLSVDVKGATNQEKVIEVLTQQHNVPEIDDRELTRLREIGRGSFAVVYRARWHGSNVAVKKLNNLSEILSHDQQLFEREVRLWSELKHPCIVSFFGVTHSLSFVMEFMEHGSLKSLMAVRALASSTRIKLATQIAIAMDFLHSRNMIHRDLNPNNVMVTGPFGQLQAKLADFGLSTVKDNPVQSGAVGTPIYSAPEVLSSKAITFKSDVYSLALTLWFIETNQEPFARCRTVQDLIATVVTRHERPSLVGCTLFPDIIQLCWAEEPNDRPNGPEIVSALQALLVPQATRTLG